MEDAKYEIVTDIGGQRRPRYAFFVDGRPEYAIVSFVNDFYPLNEYTFIPCYDSGEIIEGGRMYKIVINTKHESKVDPFVMYWLFLQGMVQDENV